VPASKVAAAPSNAKIVAGYTQLANSMKGTGVTGLSGKTNSNSTKIATSTKTLSDGALAYQQRQQTAAATAKAKTVASYTQLAESMKKTATPLSNTATFVTTYGFMGALTSLQAKDAQAAWMVRKGAAANATAGNAKYLPANIAKAAEYIGGESYLSKVTSNRKYGTLDKLSNTAKLPTLPASKSATSVVKALAKDAPLSLGNYGKLVKGVGYVGIALDPALGAYDAFANTPANASLADKITNASMGALKKADNVVVSGAAGLIAGGATSWSGPGAVVVGGTAGVAAGKAYEVMGLDEKVDGLIDISRPYVKSGVEAGIATVSTGYKYGSMVLNGINGMISFK
jgi:hypothetical protein